MKRWQELARKIIATILAVTVMGAMIWFAYTMLLQTPVFEGTLQIVLLACIGILTLATAYFFVCKILEIIAFIKQKDKAEETVKPNS